MKSRRPPCRATRRRRQGAVAGDHLDGARAFRGRQGYAVKGDQTMPATYEVREPSDVVPELRVDDRLVLEPSRRTLRAGDLYVVERHGLQSLRRAGALGGRAEDAGRIVGVVVELRRPGRSI